ncbi:MAG TPA: chemotaxis protein CheA, partial [Bacillota bacterium]|nr:chemotaxis protein CheA [Bacillota bacterium]
MKPVDLMAGEGIDDSLKSLFISETCEQLDQFIAILLDLEQDPQGQTETIHQLFRLAHNIKGSSGMMGLNELKETMHHTESMMDQVRKGQSRLDPERIDQLLQFSELVKDYVSRQNWSDTEELIHWRDAFESIAIGSTNAPLQAENTEISLILTEQEKQDIALWQEEAKPVYGLEVQFEDNAQMQGASALIFVKFLGDFGNVYKTAPAVAELREAHFKTFKLVLFTTQSLSPEQEEAITSYPLYEASAIRFRKWTYRPEENQSVVKAGHSVEPTIRVNAGKVDKLINNIGELLAIKGSLQQLYKQGKQQRFDPKAWGKLGREIERLEQFIKLFQVEIMDLRMVPVRQIFTRFPKIVRDVAKRDGKLVELKILGEETEVDKEIAEKLIDPLTHLIRNAVDHGLETGSERQASGKPEAGTVTLKASQEGDSIVFTVADDGRGLDIAKIKAKAFQAGIIPPGETLTDEEAIKLIFRPGFSTADQVSEISGRGVGLDVVQDSIKGLKGDVEIESRPLCGTIFRLKVPLTLAIIQSFLFQIADQTFAIPSAEVIENLVFDRRSLHRIGSKQFFTLRQETIPVIDLRKLFGTERTESAPLIREEYT